MTDTIPHPLTEDDCERIKTGHPLPSAACGGTFEELSDAITKRFNAMLRTAYDLGRAHDDGWEEVDRDAFFAIDEGEGVWETRKVETFVGIASDEAYFRRRAPRIKPVPPEGVFSEARDIRCDQGRTSKVVARDGGGEWFGVDDYGRARHWQDSNLRAWTPVLPDGTLGDRVDLDEWEAGE